MVLNNWQTLHPSPDGRYALLTTSEEVRMSHWLEIAQLVDVAADRVVLDIGSRSWSADSFSWSPDSAVVELGMRRYPGNHDGLRVRVFPDRSRAELHSTEGVVELAFADLVAAMEAHYERNKWEPGSRRAG